MAKIIGVHTPAELRNHIINGGLDFWQEKVGNTTTINTASTTVTKFADMFAINSQGATVKNYSVIRSTDVPSLAQSGFTSTYSSLFTMLTGIASPAASDWVSPFQYSMEGFDYENLHAQSGTFGFWVKASVAGTYSFAMGNAAGNRSYVTTFAVSGSATWEFKVISVPFDTTGTYSFDTGTGLLIYVGSVSGSTFQTGSLGAWQAGTFFTATGATNWQATTNATLQIAQFSLIRGPLGLGSKGFARRGHTVQAELAMCQRYYEKSYDLEIVPGASSAAGGTRWSNANVAISADMSSWFKTTKRITPSVAVYSINGGSAGFIRNTSNASDVAVLPIAAGLNSVGVETNAAGALATYHYQWTADSRL